MKPFEFAVSGEMVQTVWPFNTMESITQTVDGKKIIPASGATFADAIQLMQFYSATNTQQGICHNLKRNQRRISAGVKNGTYKGIKELFTAGCPVCGAAGIPIPGKEGTGIPFLHCEKCKGSFPVRSIHSGKPAISVGAGPSLNKNSHELKRVMGKAVIIACDAALKHLLNIGVRPDYVLCLEWDPLAERLFEGVGDVSDITLLLTTGASPEVRVNWKGPVYVFDSPTVRKRDRQKQLSMFGDIGTATPGGNVSASMLSILSGIQVDPIILVGHDFSYQTPGNYYASGVHRGCVPLKRHFRTHDIYGDTVYIDQTLFSYKRWHEMVIGMLAGEGGHTFINATEGGILGATYYDPEKWVKVKHTARILQYKFGKLWDERRWPTTDEAQENGFKGPNLEIMKYMTLAEAIDQYVINSVSPEKDTRMEAAA